MSLLYKVLINGSCRITSMDDVSLTFCGLQSRSSRMKGCGVMQSRLTCGDPWVDGWSGGPIVLLYIISDKQKEKKKFNFLTQQQ